MADPLVSVVLTSYNQAPWLEQAIESVISQTLTSWELLLVDNGSTDGSADIIARYADHPQVVVVRHARNRPHTVILNEAIRRTRGRYFSLLFSDDYYLPQKLEKQVATFEGLPPEYGVVYSSGIRLKPDGSEIFEPCGDHDGRVLEKLLTQPAFFLPIAPLVLRQALIDYPFDESIFMEGEGIYLKIALSYAFKPVDEALVVMREHDSNLGKEIESNTKRSVVMYERLFQRPDFPAELKHLRGRAIARMYSLGGWQMIRRERRYRQARAWLLSSIRHDPKSVTKSRVLAGIGIASLPTRLADGCMNLIDRVIGAPPPPITGPPLPVAAEDPGGD